MKDFPKITIIIPSLNVAPYIRKCMDSVLAQTLKEIEVIAIDAFSTDGTREIIEEYIQVDGRVSLIDDTEHSTGFAKNLGIEKASAPYVAFVEPDDYIAEDMMEVLYKYAIDTGADIIKANYSTFVESENEDYVFPKSVSRYRSDYNRIVYPREYTECFSWIMFEWLGIYRKDFLNQYGIRHNETKGASFQDTGFWFLTLAYARSVMLLQNHFYYYRKDNPYASVRRNDKVWDICNEYEYIEKSLNADHSLFSRLEPAFYHGFFHDNLQVFYRTETNDRMELLEKVRARMCKAIQNRKLNRELFSSDELRDLDDLLISTSFFINKINNKEKEIKGNQQLFLDYLRNKKELIIFGAGSYGSNLSYFLKENSIGIVAYADNDASKWDNIQNGVYIKSPKQCMREFPEATYLIANKNHGTEIRSDLIKQGIAENNIISCILEEFIGRLI